MTKPDMKNSLALSEDRDVGEEKEVTVTIKGQQGGILLGNSPVVGVIGINSSDKQFTRVCVRAHVDNSPVL